MRLVSQLDCRSSETSSILVRGAVGRRPWWPCGLQIRGTRFDSSPTCHGVVRKAARLPCKQALRGRYPATPPILAVVAPRWSNRSVRDRARFDSVRRLRVDAALRCPFPVQRSARPPTNAGFVQGERLRFQRSKPGSIPGLRSHAGMARRSSIGLPVRRRGFDSRYLLQRRAVPGAATFSQNRGARFNSAARLQSFRPRPGPASSKRRAARSTRAGSAMSHSSSGPGRWTLNPATRVRFPHATPHLHPRWAAGLRSQLGRFDSSWRYRSLFVVGRSRLSEGCAPGSTPGEETAGMEQRWLTSFIRSESVGSIPTPATLTTRGGTRVS